MNISPVPALSACWAPIYSDRAEAVTGESRFAAIPAAARRRAKLGRSWRPEGLRRDIIRVRT